MIVQNIDAAPHDGTVILTECGIVTYVTSKFWMAGRPVNSGRWALCSPDGNLYECADNGPFFEEPKLWTPLPVWPS